jgi:hypothetical protein
MTRGTHVELKRVDPASKCQGPLFGRETERKFSCSVQNLVLGGTEKAEGRRAAGRRKDPERVPESSGEHRRLGRTSANQKQASQPARFFTAILRLPGIRLLSVERYHRIPERQELRTTIFAFPCHRGLKINGIGRCECSQYLIFSDRV